MKLEMSSEKLNVITNAIDRNSGIPTEQMPQQDVRLYQNVTYIIVNLFRELFVKRGETHYSINMATVFLAPGKIYSAFHLIHKESSKHDSIH